MSIPCHGAKEAQEDRGPRKPVRFIFAGGFLGVGKTTALAGLAKRLIERGMRVGFITNDQAVNLVDTAIVKRMLQELGVPVEEVAGGCFCCRFDDLAERVGRVLARNPNVLIGYREAFRLVPFSVLVRPLEGEGTFAR